MSDKPTVGVIGLGSMGWGTARTLIDAGFEVWGNDVRDEALVALEEHGGKSAGSPMDLAREVDIVIVMVVNSEQTESALFGAHGAVEALAPGALVIASSTVPARFARELSARLAERDVLMLDGPVSGGAAKAAKGELSLMASGPRKAFEIAAPVLDVIAERVYDLGEEPGAGSTMKTINQLLAGVHIAASAEAMALAIQAGLAPATVYEIISNSAGGSWMWQNRVPHILEGDYAPLSAVNIFVKDLGIVLETGKEHTFPLPLTATAHQQFLAAAAAGLGGEDDSAVIKVFQKLTNIDLPTGD
ncbi:MAG: NAD(P)-dependent oxidoreductase [Rhodospirillaceae bacterium]|nr:NAD(P)-dependent oxidoreductase [Rhodospirillaceae bacterium]